jgi:hypothetical protein
MDKVFDGIYDPCILLDFGKVITAYVELELEGVEDGRVDIGYAERLVDGFFNNSIEGAFANRLIMKNGRQVFRSFAWRGFRYIRLRFGYCFENVKIHSVKALVTTYPFEEKGLFNCSDSRTNKIYDICKNTIRLCSNEYLMDTPQREQAQWLGDVSAITQGGIYACFGDTVLIEKFFRQSSWCQKPTGFIDNITNSLSSQWQNVIPDFSLWWIQAIWKHYMYCGDAGWIHNMYPHVVKIIQTFLLYIDENGLLNDMPYWAFIDWAPVNCKGECTALNAHFYGTLETVGKMAELKGDKYTVELTEEVRSGMRENFAERLYNPDTGCFADSSVNGALSEEISEHGNFSSILWGLCDEEKVDGIINKFYIEKPIEFTEAQPFYTSVVLRALEKAGRFDLAIQIVQDRWGNRFVNRGETSCYEEWYMNGSWRDGDFEGFMRTLSHAWSAFPAEFLTANMIGLEIIEPGCGKIRLSPMQTDFDYDVKYPTPKGIVHVSRKGDSVKVELPESIEQK